MPTAKVIPLHASPLPGLGSASVVATGKRLTGTRSEVWLCQAYDVNARGLVLYVKPRLSLRALMVVRQGVPPATLAAMFGKAGIGVGIVVTQSVLGLQKHHLRAMAA